MLRPDTIAFTAILAFLSGMSPIATDIYLPSLPAIGRFYAASDAEVQLTLSVFLTGYAVGMPFYGPFSDRFGRKPVLAVALVIFLLATVAAVFAPSIEALIAIRFVQALGAAGPVVLSRSVVRDVFSGQRAVRELSRMGSIAGIVPAFAPTLGGVMEGLFGWHSSFWLMGVAAAMILAAVVLKMPETLAIRAERISPRSILRSYGVCLRSKAFLVHTGVCCVCFSGLFAYVSGSSFVLQGYYHLNEVAFGAAFGAIALAYVGGTFLGTRLSVRLGMIRALGVGTALNAIGGLAMVVAVLAGPGSPFEVILTMMIYMVGVGLAMPQGTAGAIMPFPERAGAASSLLGVLQMGSAAATGVLVGHLVGFGAWPFAVVIAVGGVAAFLIDVTTRRSRILALSRAAGEG